ncbi:MAG: hypothetical protein FIB06_04040 [Betaproteobacteria bacterium]|nr:hypothetical protein [Betaproteobacteria bacterium]
MEDEERFKVWSSYAEISRKWVVVMDTKAGFIAALDLGLLGLLWSGARIQEGGCATKWIGVAATIIIVASVACAIWVALPRESLAAIFGKGIRWHGDYKPVSYYGFISQTYGKMEFAKLKNYAGGLTHAQLADEALEQHFVLSHAAARKSGFVRIAGFLLLAAASLSGLAVLTRLYG